MSEFRFKLLGHDNPFGRYPSPVVPIGKLDDELVAIFAGVDVQKVAEEGVYVRHNEELTYKLWDFDYKNDRLFAFDEHDVDAYHVVEELDYFKQLLRNPSFSKNNPFLRLSLAKVIAAPQVLSEELYNCVTNLSFSADREEFIDHWYKREREQLLSKIDPRDQWALPKTWRVLLLIQQARKPIVARPRGGFFSNSLSQSIGHGVGAAMGAALVVVAMFNTRPNFEYAYQLLLERNYDYRDVSLLLLQRTFEVLFPEFQERHPDPDIDEKSLSKLFLDSEHVDLSGLKVICAGPYAKNFGGVAATGPTANLIEGLTAAGLSETQARLFEEGIKHGGILMGVSSVREGEAWYFENEWIKS